MVQLRALWLALGLALLAGPIGAATAADMDYLHELQRKAEQLHLARDPHWLNLVHYEPSLFGGYHSLADAPAFFNAPDGKTDPESELHATLTAFFSEKTYSGNAQHPQCAFIARYHWLKKLLHFDSQRLPEQQCRRFHAWEQAINPQQVTLVFPSAYMNNPSSMFGHTLLRIDQPGQTEKTRLFSYAINFAAQTNTSNGLLFAVLGLTGGYPGFFSIMPYYEKVKEYSDMENRDIWEYQLNLNHQEIERLLEHAWELGPIYFNYFFFDENCSYQLLSLLDVARPGIELTNQFRYWAIPSDTVQAILRQKGILKKAVFRPSKLTRIQHRRAYVSEADQRRSLALANGELNTKALSRLPENRQAEVLELAYDYLQYRFDSGDLKRKNATKRLIALLRARSRLPQSASEIPPVPIPAIRPDQGHDTARLAFMGGRYEKRGYAQLQLRPAYHDLLDPDGGYVPAAQINFLDMAARYYADEDQLQLQRLRLVDIASLSPRDGFFKPISWKVNVGAERLPLLGFEDPELFFNANVGFGPTYQPADEVDVTAMLETDLAANGDLPVDYTAGLGPSLMLLWRPAESVKLMLSSRLQRYAGKLNRNFIRNRLGLGIGLTRDLSVRLNVEQTRNTDQSVLDASLGLNWYF